MKNSAKILLGISLLMSTQTIAQDIHFSQIFNNPTQINPALTGNFNGDQRVNLMHKQQWNSLGPGFNTYQLSFDNGLFKKKWKNSYLGLGLRIFSDKAGDPEMKNTSFELQLSDHLYLDDNQTLSLGLSGSFNQSSIGRTDLIWEDQYIPGSSTLGNTAESFGNLSQNFFDLGAGLAWTYSSRTNTVNSISDFNATVGASASHLTQPVLDPILSSSSQIYRRYNGFAKFYINLPGSNVAVVPSALYSRQGNHSEFVIGSLFRYEFSQGSRVTGFKSGFATSFGLFYRWKDAVAPTLFIEYAKFAVGLSYDLTVSQLANANSGRGGIELSLRFVNPNPFHHKNPTRGRPSL